MANRNQQHNSCVRRKPAVQVLNNTFAQSQVSEALVWVTNGAVNTEKSAPDAAKKYVGGRMDGYTLESDTPCLSAIVVQEPDSKVTIDKADIRLSGHGCSDFTHKGAAVLANERSTVEINDSFIETRGSTRCCTIASSGATMVINDSKLASYGGPLPEDYVPVIGPGMMEPPYPLGLGGNCRTHLSMDNSETYFNRCDIYATAWAAVSTDASGQYCYAEVNDSTITVEENGYAGYADNGCHLAFNRTKMTSGNMIYIQDGDSSIVAKDCDCTCKGLGMLIHGGLENPDDTGVIQIEGGSFAAAKQAMLCRSTNVDIYLKGVKLTSELGVLLETKVNDDRMYFTRRTVGPDMYGVQVTFEDMDMTGDLICGDTERKQQLHMVNSTLKGNIAGNPQLWLEEGSKWTSAGTSIVTLMGDVSIDSIDAGMTPGFGGRVAPDVIKAYAGEGCTLSGEYDLPSGGKLIML